MEGATLDLLEDTVIPFGYGNWGRSQNGWQSHQDFNCVSLK
jgi:hypothetical protein